MVFPKLSPFSSTFHRRRIFDFGGIILLRRSAATTTAATPGTNPHFEVEEYLVNSCGFSPEEATRALKPIAAGRKFIRSPKSLIALMKNHGFNDTQIKKIILSNPNCLYYNVSNNLAPKLKSFQDSGFSGANLINLVYSNPSILCRKFELSILPTLNFWQSLLGGSRDDLLFLFKSNKNFISTKIEKIAPNLSLLRDQCGISGKRIATVVRRHPRFILQRNDVLLARVDRVENEFGIPRSSGMFLPALWSLSQVSKEGIDEKRKLMISRFGWSEEEFISAFRKTPGFLRMSVEALVKKMVFLVEEAGCIPPDVACYPILLTYSLERRVIPRLRVIEVLKSKGMLCRESKIGTIMSYSEKVFMGKFVIPHKDKVPELEEIMYLAGCHGRGSTLNSM